MKNTDIFYQGEGIEALEHIEVDADLSFGDLLAMLAKKHGLADAKLFFEDEEQPVDERERIAAKAGRAGIKVHIHRCREVKVTVNFKDKSVRDKVVPGTTVGKVKHWAAIKKFGMTQDEASNHHLQLAGTTRQPDPGTHVGTLVTAGTCSVEFDLVPTPRVNG